MFGPTAPVWEFLAEFGSAPHPFACGPGSQVFETYPVLALVAFGWLLPDSRPTGRLPKYNPGRRSSFSLDDWRYACRTAADAFERDDLAGLAAWLRETAECPKPTKRDQDQLDACLCLLVAVHVFLGREALIVGDMASGYMLVPHNPVLADELHARCRATNRDPDEWVTPFRLVEDSN